MGLPAPFGPLRMKIAGLTAALYLQRDDAVKIEGPPSSALPKKAGDVAIQVLGAESVRSTIDCTDKPFPACVSPRCRVSETRHAASARYVCLARVWLRAALSRDER